MKLPMYCVAALAMAVVTCLGCGETRDAAPAANTVDASQFTLTAEPAGAVGVIAARQSAEDGAPLVLVGRIGGAKNPWVNGRAAFTLIDASMNVVADGEGMEDEDAVCNDDCCAAERLGCTTLVKVVDQNGQLVGVDSRELLGLKEADTVVVSGKAKKDDSGNFVMLAHGVYVRD